MCSILIMDVQSKCLSTNIYPSKKNIMPQKKKKGKLLTEKILLETVSHICLRSVVYNIR